MKHHWLLSCIALFGLSLGVRALAQVWPISTLSFDGNQWLGQPWVWFTAPLLTPSFNLWLAHLGSLLLLGFWGHALQASRRDTLLLWLCWPLCTLGLVFWSDPLVGANGLSGMTHAAGGILLMRLSAQAPNQWVSALATALLAFKLGLEHAWQTPHAFSADWGTPLWPAMNLSGALAGMALAQVAFHGRATTPYPNNIGKAP